MTAKDANPGRDAQIPDADARSSLVASILLGTVMLAIFAIMLVAPTSASLALLPMLACVAGIATFRGLRAGVVALVGAVALVGGVALFGEAALGLVPVVFFAGVGGVTVGVLDGIARSRRRGRRNLERWNAALRSPSTATVDLSANLDAIVATMVGELGPADASVLLLRRGHLELVASAAMSDADPAIEERVMSDDGSPVGPIAEAIATREIIIDHEADGSGPLTTQRGIAALRFARRHRPSRVVVPLIADEAVLGVLSVRSASPIGFTDDDVALLRIYADQLSLAVSRARAFEAERASAQRLGEADALKSEFLAMVSHELRTPLTAAKGFIDTVLLHWDQLGDDRRQELLRRASRNANELTRLISQLLDFARTDADRVEVAARACSLDELVRRVTTDIAPVVAERTLAVDLDPTLKVITDPDIFNHVLVNLITNANKFSPLGSTIRITATPRGREVTIAVADEGVGIAADELELVFERFYQSERTNPGRNGTGIGLAIVKRFVEQQGGRIWVESTLGEGATFKFTVALVERRGRAAGGDANAAFAVAGLTQPPPSREVKSETGTRDEAIPT